MLQTLPKIAFRVIHDADRDFLFSLFAAAREWEFEHTAWKDDEKAAFLKRQFDIRTQAYQMNYLGASHRIITLDDTDIGQLILDRRDDYMLIVDFVITPDFQGKGIGSDILKSLINEAHGGKVPIRLHVEKNNPALHLYLRHGFKVEGEQGHHHKLTWSPDLRPAEI